MCVWAVFKARECVCVKEGEEGWLHTRQPYFVSPTHTPAEIGHPWPTCSLLLTPAHAHLSFFLTDQMPHSPCIHAHTSCFRTEKQSRCAALTEFHALQMQTHDFAYSFACLYQITHPKSDCLFIHSSSFLGFYCCRGDSKTWGWGWGGAYCQFF